MVNNTKTIVYLHRYPIEYEKEQFAAAERILSDAAEKARVVYYSMRPTTYKPRLANVEFAEIPFTLDRTSGWDKLLKTLLYYLYLPIMIYRLRTMRPDFIICKEILPFVPTLVLMLKRPTIIDVADWWLTIYMAGSKLGTRLADCVERFEIRQWNRRSKQIKMVVHTQYEASRMLHRGYRDKIWVIDYPQYSSVYFHTNKRSPNALWTVAVHGIIHPSKGYDQLLSWWKNIVVSHQDWRLLIIGGAIGETWCRCEVKKLGLDKHVVMTGWIKDHKDVNQLLNDADCLLVTRRNSPENLGVISSSLFHSLAVGRPVVATGLPGMKEVINHKVNGYIYTPDSYESFAATLEYIHDNPEIAESAAHAGVATAAARFNSDRCAQTYLNLIFSIP